MVGYWMVAGIVAVCEWMLKVSYHVVSSGTGCMRCHATISPLLGTNFCCGHFISFYKETCLVHWAHRIEDTGALDVDEFYYLFIYLSVRTQYNQRGYLRGCQREY